jgi:hypothetical protein
MVAHNRLQVWPFPDIEFRFIARTLHCAKQLLYCLKQRTSIQAGA